VVAWVSPECKTGGNSGYLKRKYLVVKGHRIGIPNGGLPSTDI
jgi:hypothetical protein